MSSYRLVGVSGSASRRDAETEESPGCLYDSSEAVSGFCKR